MDVLKVLIVDDHKDIADSLALTVQSEGHRAFVAYSTLKGTELAGKVLPDIIHDLALPDMSGFEAAELLRATPSFSRTILVAHTGPDTERERRRAQEVGFHHFVVKPMPCDFLIGLLNGRLVAAPD